MNIILAVLIGVPLVYVVMSQTIIGTSMDFLFKTDVTTPAPKTTTQKAAESAAALKRAQDAKAEADQLQNQKDKAVAQRDANDTQLKAEETALKSAQDDLSKAKAKGGDTTAEEGKLNTQQQAYDKAKSSYDASNTEVTKANEKLEATPFKREEKINAYYKELIKANEAKGTELSQKKASTPEEQKIIDQQKSANGLYGELLKAKQAVETCQVTTTPCASIEDKKAAQIAAENKLREQISLLTYAEQTINKGMTFPVSEIFRPTGQAAKKLSLLDVTNKIANWMITLVTSLAVTALIIGGFIMIISGGDESRLEEGKTIFTYSLIGLAVTLMAYGIIATIRSLFI